MLYQINQLSIKRMNELHGKEPYYPMLPNGELDVEGYKLKREEERMRLEAERKAYEKSFGGRLEKILTFLGSLMN